MKECAPDEISAADECRTRSDCPMLGERCCSDGCIMRCVQGPKDDHIQSKFERRVHQIVTSDDIFLKFLNTSHVYFGSYVYL